MKNGFHTLSRLVMSLVIVIDNAGYCRQPDQHG
jgi:hypothetical protein